MTNSVLLSTFLIAINFFDHLLYNLVFLLPFIIFERVFESKDVLSINALIFYGKEKRLYWKRFVFAENNIRCYIEYELMKDIVIYAENCKWRSRLDPG